MWRIGVEEGKGRDREIEQEREGERVDCYQTCGLSFGACFLYFVNFDEQTGKTVLPEEKPLLTVLVRTNKQYSSLLKPLSRSSWFKIQAKPSTVFEKSEEIKYNTDEYIYVCLTYYPFII